MAKTKTIRKSKTAPRASKTRTAAKKPVKQPLRATTTAAKAARGKAPAKVRGGTKQEILIERLRKGATIAELTRATGWQAHSVRGAISGTLKKKLGFAVTSEKTEGKDRIYRLTSAH